MDKQSFGSNGVSGFLETNKYAPKLSKVSEGCWLFAAADLLENKNELTNNRAKQFSYLYPSLVTNVCLWPRIRTKDKKDRATVEQVLDPRTRMILYQLMDRQYFSEINGSVSMGKVRGRVGRRATKTVFASPVLTGLNWLAETPSGRNWRNPAKTQMTKIVVFSGLQLLETYKCVSGCHWDISALCLIGFLVGDY